MADTHLRVPGRIEVLGKHVDYAGGRSLLCATEGAFDFAVTVTSTGMFRLRDGVSGQQVALDPGRVGRRRSVREPAWAIYPRAVLRRIVADFGADAIGGCDVEFTSDLPSASGLSSSSAFVVGLFLALDATAHLLDSEVGRRALPDVTALAGYLGAVESGHVYPGFADAGTAGVGVRGGAQDHTAVLCARAGALLQAGFGPVRLENEVGLHADLVFVIGVSGVQAPKAGAVRDRYNAVSDTGRRVAEVWRAQMGITAEDAPHLGAIVAGLRRRGAAPDEVVREVEAVLRRSQDPEIDALIGRTEQFVEETEVLVPGVVAGLRAGDMESVGRLVDRSQALADRVLGNQVPETRALARTAREIGAVAASAFGAGFGGAVWALVSRADASAFSAAWQARYIREFPKRARRAAFFATGASDPAGPLPARLRLRS